MARPRSSPRPRRHVTWTVAGLLAAAVAFGLSRLLPVEGTGPDLVGPARVVDGDTLDIAGTRIRLQGIDAPEARQTCQRQGSSWACGADATQALRALVDGRALRCTPQDRDRYDRVVAICRLDGQDLNGWMVREGWAVAYTDYTRRYLPEEWLAWWEGRGLWSSRFERPSDWRREHRD